jgi:NADH:ubiquinone oxidoreductase subunit F (NADH-binding)
VEPRTGEHIVHDHEIPFYKHQQRIVLKNIGKIDPTDIRDTIAVGGYEALGKALTTMSPDEVIEITGETILKKIGGLPEDEKHCAFLSANALQEALNDYMIKQKRKER